MKYLKIFIIALSAIAVCFVIYYITKPVTVEDVSDVEDVPIAQQKIREKIKNKIINASDDKFCCVDAYQEIKGDIDFQYQKETPNENIHRTLIYELEREYTTKFIRQAKHHFATPNWKANDEDVISRELNRCSKFACNIGENNSLVNDELKRIKEIKTQYDSLKAYYNKVKTASEQKPKQDVSSLYGKDDWDKETTKKLLTQTFSLKNELLHCNYYALTTKEAVRSTLKKGHTSFIEKKLKYAETEAKSYNFNEHRAQDYRTMCGKLDTCFNTYEELWGDCPQEWINRMKSWRIYTEPQINN